MTTIGIMLMIVSEIDFGTLVLNTNTSCFKTNLFAPFSLMANTNCTLLILYGYEQERDVAKCLVDDLDIQQVRGG